MFGLLSTGISKFRYLTGGTHRDEVRPIVNTQDTLLSQAGQLAVHFSVKFDSIVYRHPTFV